MTRAQFGSAGVFDPTGILAEGGTVRTEKVTLLAGQAYLLGHPLKLNLGKYEEVADETEIDCILLEAIDATAGDESALVLFQGAVFTKQLPAVAGVTYADARTALAEKGLFLR